MFFQSLYIIKLPFFFVTWPENEYENKLLVSTGTEHPVQNSLNYTMIEGEFSEEVQIIKLRMKISTQQVATTNKTPKVCKHIQRRN